MPESPSLITRVRRKFRQPSDILLTWKIGMFIWRVRHHLGSAELPPLLDRVRAASRPPADDLASAVERIARLRRPWFRLPAIAPYNTCFMRALTLYRFLDPCGGDMRIHFVIEGSRGDGNRLHSHAWVTVDDVVIEERDLRPEGVREIYQHRLTGPPPAPARHPKPKQVERRVQALS